MLIHSNNLHDFDFPFYISLIFVVGFFGSKLFYLLEDFNIKSIKFKFINIKNGYVLYGGLIFVFLSSYYYAKSKNINKLILLDLNTIALCLSVSMGKIACLSTGCCYGLPTNLKSIGLVYSNKICLAYPKNEPLFPIQIMDSLFALVLFFVYLYIHKVKKLEPGSVFSSFCIIYPIYRFISENFRADVSRGFVFDGLLSLSQFYSLLVLLIVLIYKIVLKFNLYRI
jgi:phosphatidylglycerol:prolipoprotein diacylglycerol transferase